MHVVYASNKDADQSSHLRIVKSAIFVRIVETKVWCLQFLTKTTLSRLYAARAEDRVFIPLYMYMALCDKITSYFVYVHVARGAK